MYFLDKAKSIEDQIIAWRRDIHMHPELGFEETRTAKLVANALNEMGIEAEVGVGITGVVARIGEGRPAIGIRADMDALPIQEANDTPYKSQTPGVMHACGHDAHTAILLGVARILNEMPDRPAGEIRLLFQPSEEKWDAEGKSGATRMIDDNALEDLDAVIALHVSSVNDNATFEIVEGFALAAVDTFYATIFGEGTHGATPHQGIDPIYIQAQVINAIQGIRARRLDPTRGSVITVGGVHGGSAPNVIPDKVEMMGTIRSFDEETRTQIHEELERAFGVARALGGDYTLKIERGYPAMYNDPSVAQLLYEVAKDNMGADRVHHGVPMMGAEDFAYMTQKAPGAMFMLGAKLDEKHRPHHSPVFDINEDSFKYGAAVLADTACRLLKKYAR
ncbi:MAG: amidohydrolase [Chloroflexi bacterium]|nr:MAG: amidohydrolase [Chloroflexota bacterium]